VFSPLHDVYFLVPTAGLFLYDIDVLYDFKFHSYASSFSFLAVFPPISLAAAGVQIGTF
jgi:hypothetical protein